MYLDTSALELLIGLYATSTAANKQGGKPHTESSGLKKAQLLRDWLKTTGVTPVTSPITLTEVAHLATKLVRKKALRNRSQQDWFTFRKEEPGLASQADAEAATARGDAFAAAAKTMLNYKIRLEMPSAMPRLLANGQIDRSVPDAFASELQTGLRSLLTTYKSIDATDALHILLGRSLLVDGFVTFDEGWQSVKEISVFIG